ARRSGKLRDSYGRTVHGEIPEGVSPRKLTVRPWKASDFPDLQALFLWRKQSEHLEAESSTKGSFSLMLTVFAVLELTIITRIDFLFGGDAFLWRLF
ncbi:hypothetical protein, partial [Halobacillus campisalis]|uniref:hypothetical protein n=1 Tax=Halobacillus campisalis TaxID=435909 RepID=UPI00259BE871